MPSGWKKNLAKLENWGNSNRKEENLTKKEKRAHDKVRRLKRLERAEFNNYHVSKIRGKKKALGASSRKYKKRGVPNQLNGAGNKGNSDKHIKDSSNHPICKVKFHKRMIEKKSMKKYLQNFHACAVSA